MTQIRIFFLFIVFISNLCLANTNDTSDPWYQVEIVVFENNDPKALSEHWPVDPGKPNFNKVKYLKRYTENDLQNFQLLPKNNYQLQDAKQRLKQKGHRMLFHRAWRQQIGSEQSSKALRLIGGKRYKIIEQPAGTNIALSAQHNISGEATVHKQYEMDGVITITRGRYLHVNTDFVFYKPMRVVNEATRTQGFSSRMPQNAHDKIRLAFVGNKKNWQTDPSNKLQPLRMSQNRRMKSNEVHYVDHPFYGMLISVTPVKI